MLGDWPTTHVLEKLEEFQIDYLLVGAFSSNAYGVVRSTNDADIVVSFEHMDVVAFSNSLGSEFQLDRQMLLETFTGTVRNVIRHLPTGFDIELFRLSDDAHQQMRFARRCRTMIDQLGREAWIPTAEDVVIQKLRWGRRKDLDDIVNVLIVSGHSLDWEYIGRWADEHETTALLEQLRQEAGV